MAAAFYPLQFAAERVGGDHVVVTNLTPPGAEPHDVELSARDVAGVLDADLVVYLSGFSPAIDDVAEEAAGFDVGAVIGGDGPRDDVHFWLDPTLLADVADALADELSALRPDAAGDFRSNAAALRAELEQLDAELMAGLADCEVTAIVTSHRAFGYLAARYGLREIGISGLSPHEEPSPARMAEISEYVRDHGVTTIYYETLVDPAIAETIADETGAAIAVLDPLEGLTPDAAGGDYVAVMRANLQALRDGQGCA